MLARAGAMGVSAVGYRVLAVLALALHALVVRADAAAALRTPAELYPGLFERVQLERVYDDGKTFVDAVPHSPPEQVMHDYQRAQTEAGFDLRAFVNAHFEVPRVRASDFRSRGDRSIQVHIDELWPVLERAPDTSQPYSSLVPLPHRYLVPGGRFREIYYWDSYFTMLGLEQSGRHDVAADMVRNFAHLIDRFGHIPNGNRTYYLSRSQPPFFAAMVNLIAAREGEGVYARYLPQLAREYAFWMEGEATLPRGAAHRRVVRLRGGTVLNRYWDDRETPREESYREDVETARAANRPPQEVHRNLRAAAESGWDFSSRWLADGRTLATIRTVDIVPVDLNSLLYGLEQTLARAYRASGEMEQAAEVSARAWRRREAIHRYLWDSGQRAFGDYAWREGRLTGHLSAATLYPLFSGVATRTQAHEIATTVRVHLLEPDGLATTKVNTGQQWDAPNGWAPLQWMAIAGLNDYGERDLARDIAQRWIRENLAFYRATGRLVEKYDVSGDAAARGGEYPLQDGFGWTNGVLRRLLALYPLRDSSAALLTGASGPGGLFRDAVNPSLEAPAKTSVFSTALKRPPGPDAPRTAQRFSSACR
jgi:alpha,alpha-trehalase